MVRVALAAAEHERRHAERGGVLVVRPGTSSPPHGQYASIHRSIVSHELAAVLVEDALPVRRVAGDHLFPLGERGDRLHAARSTRFDEVLAAVVHAQAHEPEGAAADPPEREPGGDVGVARRGEQRHPRAARAAGDDRRRQVEVRGAGAARVSACMADSDAPVKHTSDAPQFGRSQISDLVARLGERLGQLPDAGVVLAEPAARRDRPGPARRR